MQDKLVKYMDDVNMCQYEELAAIRLLQEVVNKRKRLDKDWHDIFKNQKNYERALEKYSKESGEDVEVLLGDMTIFNEQIDKVKVLLREDKHFSQLMFYCRECDKKMFDSFED